MTEFSQSIQRAVREIADNRRQIVDDYCKALLAKMGGNEREIYENLEKIVIHFQSAEGMRCANEKVWVTFDAKQSFGDWQPIDKLYKDPHAKALLIWDGNDCNIYGPDFGQVMLKRDLNEKVAEMRFMSKDCKDNEWIEQEDTCGDPDGTYSKMQYFSPTHWMPWPDIPKAYH